jgi:hypothetical protein
VRELRLDSFLAGDAWTGFTWYTSVVDELRSRSIAADLIRSSAGWFAIEINGHGIPRLLLMDYFDSLPACPAEQVGWSISTSSGDILAVNETPTIESALRIIRAAIRTLALRGPTTEASNAA